jgi:hypothetical protein
MPFANLPLAFHATMVVGTGLGLFGLLFLVASAFWLWMLIDCLTSALPSTEKLVWVLVILFTHLLGAVLYFAIARSGSGRGAA